MRHATKLRLRIFEVSDRASGVGTEIADVVVRRLHWRFIARQDRLRLVIQGRDRRLVCFRVASKQAILRECHQIQTIDEWPIALRR